MADDGAVEAEHVAGVGAAVALIDLDEVATVVQGGGRIDGEIDFGEAGGGIFVGIALLGDFLGEGAGDEEGAALLEPVSFDELGGEVDFDGIAGVEDGEVLGADGFELVRVFVEEEAEGAAGEAVFGGVACGAGEAFGRFGAFGKAAIGDVGGDGLGFVGARR